VPTIIPAVGSGIVPELGVPGRRETILGLRAGTGPDAEARAGQTGKPCMPQGGP